MITSAQTTYIAYRRRKWLVAISLCSLTPIFCVFLSSAPATAASTTRQKCAPVRESRTSHIDASGNTTSSTSAATKHVYSTNGTTITTVDPPTGFDPTTASDREMRAYGLTPHVRNGQKLGRGEHDRTPPKPFTAWSAGHGFCITDRRTVSSGNSLSSSTNWSGLITDGTIYDEVDAEWTQPSFSSTCAGASSYSIWPGIGGTSSSDWGLIQAGTDTGPSSANDIYTWIELISAENPFPEIKTDFPVSPGDTFVVYVWWDAANQSADFEFYNVTQGLYGGVAVASVGGVPAINFYDSRSAEVISERATDSGTGDLLELRKPTSGLASFDGMDVNDGPVENDTSLYTEDMVDDDGNPMSTVDNMYSSSGFTYWDTTWHRCN